jgi:formate dehydrogenase assembly factor FdhD
LAVEEPLQIRLGDPQLAIAMRTPGNDEELAVGFLFTEGILSGRNAIASVTPGENSITVTLSGEASVDLSAKTRHFYLTSSCGRSVRRGREPPTGSRGCRPAQCRGQTGGTFGSGRACP